MTVSSVFGGVLPSHPLTRGINVCPIRPSRLTLKSSPIQPKSSGRFFVPDTPSSPVVKRLRKITQPEEHGILSCYGSQKADPTRMLRRLRHVALVVPLFPVSQAFRVHVTPPVGSETTSLWKPSALQCCRCYGDEPSNDLPKTRPEAVKQILHAISAAVAWGSLAIDSEALESDEFEETFDDQAIGIELTDVKYKGSNRVLVKRVLQESLASRRPRIKPDLVLVSVNGEGLERATASAAKEIIKKNPRPLTIVFRDPSKFNQLLTPDSLSARQTDSGEFEPISTKIAPEGKGQDEQVLRLLSSEKSPSCGSEACQGARRGDLLEIEYTGKLEDGKVFDGSSIMVNGREIVGRAGDKTLFFVLGKQPKGQFPPGWDLLLIGMCVGETRVISVPPLLGYGGQGFPRRGIPPNATLLYDVKLIGINGVNMCGPS